MLDSKAVLFACAEVLAQEIPVFAVGESPTGWACLHGGFPRVEATVFVAVFLVVVVAVATLGRLVGEVFGEPVVVADFHNLVGVAVARVLELFRGGFFGGGGCGDAGCQKHKY